MYICVHICICIYIHAYMFIHAYMYMVFSVELLFGIYLYSFVCVQRFVFIRLLKSVGITGGLIYHVYIVSLFFLYVIHRIYSYIYMVCAEYYMIYQQIRFQDTNASSSDNKEALLAPKVGTGIWDLKLFREPGPISRGVSGYI